MSEYELTSVLELMQDGESGWSEVWAMIANEQGNVKYVGGNKWCTFDEKRKLWNVDEDDSEVGIGYAIPQLREWFRQHKKEITKASKDDRVDYNDIVNEALASVARKGSCYTAVAKGARRFLKDSNFFYKLNKANPSLLPIKDGEVIDLETGKIRTRTATDYFTFECDAKMGTAPGYHSSRHTEPSAFELYLESMWPDRVERRWMQQFAGLVISGEHYKGFFFFLGKSNSGKSVFVKLLQRLLTKGGYQPLKKSVVVEQKGAQASNSHTSELNKHADKRLSTMTEFPDGGKLNNQSLKSLTGDDEIPIRGLSKEEVGVTISSTIIIQSNNDPSWTPEEGMTTRLYIINFSQVFVEDPKGPGERKSDSKLKQKIENNEDDFVDDFLAWAVQGAKKFYANDKVLPPLPPGFASKREELISKSNSAKRYVDSQLARDKASKLLSKEIFQRFIEWCEENDHEHATQTMLGKELSSAGYEKKQTSVKGQKGMAWLGVKYAEEK